ncbi:MAG TPA: hypothetical protein VN840_03785 [Streptosporangiaceae bacterium]|nr:hypothetical protein [Streptosporangiaceae bacterium]
MRTRRLAALATAALTGSILLAGVSPLIAAASGPAQMSRPAHYQITVTRTAPALSRAAAAAARGHYGCCKS